MSIFFMSISGCGGSHDLSWKLSNAERLVSMMGRKVGPIGCDLMVEKDDQKVRCLISTSFWTLKFGGRSEMDVRRST